MTHLECIFVRSPPNECVSILEIISIICKNFRNLFLYDKIVKNSSELKEF
jgi:hypothetical protein